MECSLIFLTCILSSLVTTSLSLSCIECIGVDEKSCIGESKPCPEGADACVATYDTNTESESGKTTGTYKRYCGTRQNCTTKGSFSSSFSTLKISSSCCFTSNCAPSVPVLPADKSEKNGVSCMDCQGTVDNPCTSTTKRDCTGDENTCAHLIPPKGKSVRGCGTSTLCGAKVIPFGYEDIQFDCMSGAALFPASLAMLLLPSILLIRVIG